MANVKELKAIFKYTPIEQAILLEGGHGIGKSEIMIEYAKSEERIPIIIFLGQSSDAGDIIGLPSRITVIDEDGVEHLVTDFASPKWWPRNPKGKYLIFLDEINRSPTDARQCIMDMVLNRKLVGKTLPADTRIVSAMNPTEDGYYQVDELDPALLDRFNVYPFRPTSEDWIEWAYTENVHDSIISFISKYKLTYLDPPSAKEAKSNQVHPSRRSWKRVSDILNKHGEELFDKDMHTLANILTGIVGTAATSQFISHIKEMGTGLNAALVLTKLDEKILKKISQIPMQQQIHLVTQTCIWLDENIEKIKESKTFGKKILGNLEQFLGAIHTEAQSTFLSKLKVDHQEYQKEWPKIVASGSANIGAMFKEKMR